MTAPPDPFSKLQSWYKDQCNGDWEQQFGVNIETIDNPGWLVTIDLEGTEWEKLVVPTFKNYIDEDNFFFYEVNKGKFIGSGDPGKLPTILTSFFQVIGR